VNAIGPGASRSYMIESMIHSKLPDQAKDSVFDLLYENCSLLRREVFLIWAFAWLAAMA